MMIRGVRRSSDVFPDVLVATGVALALLVASVMLVQAASDFFVQAAALSSASLAFVCIVWRRPA